MANLDESTGEDIPEDKSEEHEMTESEKRIVVAVANLKTKKKSVKDELMKVKEAIVEKIAEFDKIHGEGVYNYIMGGYSRPIKIKPRTKSVSAEYKGIIYENKTASYILREIAKLKNMPYDELLAKNNPIRVLRSMWKNGEITKFVEKGYKK